MNATSAAAKGNPFSNIISRPGFIYMIGIPLFGVLFVIIGMIVGTILDYRAANIVRKALEGGDEATWLMEEKDRFQKMWLPFFDWKKVDAMITAKKAKETPQLPDYDEVVRIDISRLVETTVQAEIAQRLEALGWHVSGNSSKCKIQGKSGEDLGKLLDKEIVPEYKETEIEEEGACMQ